MYSSSMHKVHKREDQIVNLANTKVTLAYKTKVNMYHMYVK